MNKHKNCEDNAGKEKQDCCQDKDCKAQDQDKEEEKQKQSCESNHTCSEAKMENEEANVEETESSKIAELEDRYLRIHAEFQNYKKRVEREKVDLIKHANIRLITDFLSVLDNMERALNSSKESTDEKLAAGMQMVAKSLTDALKQNGVTEIEAKGEAFNHDLHHAVMTEAVEGVEAGTVLEVLQTGYKLHDKVIRPSMVKVSE